MARTPLGSGVEIAILYHGQVNCFKALVKRKFYSSSKQIMYKKNSCMKIKPAAFSTTLMARTPLGSGVEKVKVDTCPRTSKLL